MNNYLQFSSKPFDLGVSKNKTKKQDKISLENNMTETHFK